MERSTTFTGHVQVYHNRARAAFGLRGWLRPREHKCARMRGFVLACGSAKKRPPLPAANRGQRGGPAASAAYFLK